MSDQEILLKAIEKAMAAGYLYPRQTATTEYRDGMLGPRISFGEYVVAQLVSSPINVVYDVLYDHDFAKALWGEETQAFGGVPRLLMKWQYHLQQMVIADDPIAYLGERI